MFKKNLRTRIGAVNNLEPAISICAKEAKCYGVSSKTEGVYK